MSRNHGAKFLNIGLGAMAFSFPMFAIFGFLGLMWFEPPIESPSMLHPGARAGEVLASGSGEAWFEVAGLESGALCTLSAQRPDGSVAFRVDSRAGSGGSGCRASAKMKQGEVLVLSFTGEAPSALMRAYVSHGDGFPHIGAILSACLLIGAAGFIAFVYGLVQRRRSSV
jgi:hypothetical protein